MASRIRGGQKTPLGQKKNYGGRCGHLCGAESSPHALKIQVQHEPQLPYIHHKPLETLLISAMALRR